MTDPGKSEVVQGTLDLMILKTLQASGPQHGFGIARRIEQSQPRCTATERRYGVHVVVAAAQQRWIVAEWGTFDHNRKAQVLLHHRAGREAARR
jgi:PadR family transcriptional regulator, regulatory protein PadR